MPNLRHALPSLLAASLMASSSVALAAPPPNSKDDEADAAGDEFDPMRDDPRAVEARRWRNTGIALMIVGTLVGGGALAIGLADPCRPVPGNDCRLHDRQRAALAVGVPAAVVFSTGLVSFGVGQSRLGRLRVSFSASRGSLSFGLWGRF